MSEAVLARPVSPVVPGKARRPLVLPTLRDVIGKQERRGRLPANGRHIDGVTGLLDRAGLQETLAALVESGEAGRGVGAMLCVDLGGPDALAALQAAWGRGAVDELLCSTAAILRRAVREADAVGRLGADDFIVVLEGLGELSNARRIAETALVALRALRLPDGSAPSPRIGATRLPASARAVASLLAAREQVLAAE